MDKKRLRKLAGLLPINEAVELPPKVEREIEKLGDQLEKINNHYAAVSSAFEVFNSYLQALHRDSFITHAMHEANREAAGYLRGFRNQ